MKSINITNSVTVIIPTYTNTGALKSLLRFLVKNQIQTIVVDNKPTKEKKQFVQSIATAHSTTCLQARQVSNQQSAIIYLPQNKNTGFARAVNIGAKVVKTKWLLILNDDVLLNDKNIFDRLIQYAEEKDYCAVSPVLKNSDGKIENLGYRVLPIGRVELNFDKNEPIDQRKIDGLTAACILIKSSVYCIAGGFDERFFAYLEDVDLFLRLKKKGYAFGIDLKSEVIHNSHTTSAKMGNFKQKQDLKNWVLIILKNWNKKTLIMHFPQIIIERFRNLSGYIKTI